MKPLRILLVDVNQVSLDTSVDMVEYPIGLLYVATALKREYGDLVGVRIESYDGKTDPPEKIEELLNEFKPDILGLRSLTMGRKPMHGIATLAKGKFNVPLVIAGGPHATDSPQDILSNDSFDCAVIGEGEQTAVVLVSHYMSNRSLSEVKGIAVRSSNGMEITSGRIPLEDLDQLPVPDYQLVDFQKINEGHVDFSFRYNISHANLFTSRGCPYRCLYCHHLFGKQVRVHSPERIMTEIRMLHDEYGIRDFQIIDDIFNIDRNRAMKFFDMVARSNLDLVLSFPNGLRGDRVDKEMIDAMWETGVRYVAYAIETGSPRIQKLIRKNLDLDRIAEAISLSTSKGIVTRGFFMIGFPTETEEEARMTIDFANSSDLVLGMFFSVVYFPGTPLFQFAREMSGISDFDLSLEDDYVRTREGPYAFSRDTLEKLKLKTIRKFFFSSKRLRLFFDIMPNYYNRRDMDASMFVNIISGKIEEKDIKDDFYAKKLHRYFIIADRFSEKSGFFV